MDKINRLFLRLGGLYGHLWMSQYKHDKFLTVAKEDWARALHHFDENIIDVALAHCVKRFHQPITLPQFYDLCKSLVKEKRAERMTSLRCNPAIAEVAIKKCYEILKGKQQ